MMCLFGGVCVCLCLVCLCLWCFIPSSACLFLFEVLCDVVWCVIVCVLVFVGECLCGLIGLCVL